jgi:hypothetical protein
MTGPANTAALPEVGGAPRPAYTDASVMRWAPFRRHVSLLGQSPGPLPLPVAGTERPGFDPQHGAAFGIREFGHHVAEVLSGLHGVVLNRRQALTTDRQTVPSAQLRTTRDAPVAPWDAGLTLNRPGERGAL